MQEFQERNVFFDSTPLPDADDYCRCRDWCVEDYDLSVWQPQQGARRTVKQAMQENAQQVTQELGLQEMQENAQLVAQWSDSSDRPRQPCGEAWQMFGAQAEAAQPLDTLASEEEAFAQDFAQQEMPEQEAYEQEAYEQEAHEQEISVEDMPQVEAQEQSFPEVPTEPMPIGTEPLSTEVLLPEAAAVLEMGTRPAPVPPAHPEPGPCGCRGTRPAPVPPARPKPRPCGCRGTGPINDMSGRRTPPAPAAYNDWLWPDTAPVQPAPLPATEIAPEPAPTQELMLDTIDNASGYEQELVHV